MDILSIKNQRYSSLLGNFQICRNCKFVDKDINRTKYEYKCPVCNKKSKGGLLYFHMGILSLLDLIQEAYHSDFIIKSEHNDEETRFESLSHTLSVIIFYVTLRDVLMQNFLDEVAEIKNISESIYKRLLTDNRLYTQKQNNLFSALLEIKWKEAIVFTSSKDNADYSKLNDFLQAVADTRNKFLHEGNRVVIKKILAKESILNITPLLDFYVSLHNNYVHPNYLM